MSEQLKKLVNTFARVEDADWNSVKHLIRSQSLKKGEHFLSLGDKSDRFGIVEEGLFRIYYVDQEGNEAIKTFRGAGGVIGAYAEFLKNIPCRLNVEALTDSVVSIVSAEDMLAAFKMAGPWERIGRKIAEQLYLEKEEREYQFLCLNASERYQAFLRDFADYESRIPDYMVASFLGITPVYLSKLKREK